MAFLLKINGTPHEVDVDGDTPLLWVLHDALGIPMLQADSAEIGTLQRSPRDGLRIGYHPPPADLVV